MKADGGLEDEGNGYCSHEQGRERGNPVAFALPSQKGGRRPQNQHGQGLVAPAEIAPDQVEILGADKKGRDEQRYCQKQSVCGPGLGQAEGFRQDQAAGSKGRVPRCDGQDDNPQDGQKSAHRTKQGPADLVHHQGGRTALNDLKQGVRAMEQGHPGRGPDQGDDPLGDHGAVEHQPPAGFVADAAGHERGLRGMKAADGPAGQGDEQQRPDGQALRVRVHGYVQVGQHLSLAQGQAHEYAQGHEQQERAEKGVQAADKLVDGQDGGQEVVTEDAGHEKLDVQAGQIAQQLGRTEDEHHAHEEQQQQGKEAHHPAGVQSQESAHHVRNGRALVAYREHPAEIIVHRSRENRAHHDPDQSHRAVQRTKDRPEDRSDPGDVQKLDEKDLPGGHGGEVYPVGHGGAGGRTAGIRAENTFHHLAIGEVAQDEQADA